MILSRLIFRRKFKASFILVCASFLFEAYAFNASAAPPPGSNWTPDLSTTRGRIEFFISVNDRHPGIARRSLEYRRNLFDILKPLPEVRALLGEQAASEEYRAVSVFGSVFTTDGVELQYDEARVALVRNHLIEALRLFPLKKLNGFEKDIEAIVDLASNEHDKAEILKTWISSYLKLVPFLYNGAGVPVESSLSPEYLNELRERFSSISGIDLDPRYSDLYRLHQFPALEKISDQRKFSFFKPLLNLNEKHFINKDVKAAGSLTNAKGSIEKRVITYEEISSAITHFRADMAFDCSKLSIPYYGNVKGAKVFWIRKTRDLSRQPDGYVFVTEAELNGQTLPYIVTINGVSLSVSDVREVVYDIAKKWKTSNVILSDMVENPWVVNYPAMRDGMTWPNSKSVKVKMSKGWDIVSKYQDEHKLPNYQNFYQSERLMTAKLAEIDLHKNSQAFFELEPEHYYFKPRGIESLSKLERSIIANDALEGVKNPLEIAEITQTLEVTDLEMKTAQPLSSGKPLTVEQFEALYRIFEYQLKDILELSPTLAGKTLTSLYESGRLQVEIVEWQKVFARSYKNVLNELKTFLERKGPTLSSNDRKLFVEKLLVILRIPESFISNPVDNLQSLISSVDSYVSESAIEQMVAHLKSPESIAKLKALALKEVFQGASKEYYQALGGKGEKPVVELAFEAIGDLGFAEQLQYLSIENLRKNNLFGTYIAKQISKLPLVELKPYLSNYISNYICINQFQLWWQAWMVTGALTPQDPEFEQMLNLLLVKNYDYWFNQNFYSLNSDFVKKVFEKVTLLPIEKAWDLLMGKARAGNTSLFAASAMTKLDFEYLRKRYLELMKVGNYNQTDFEFMLNYLLDVAKLPASDPLIELMIQSVLDTSYDYWFVKNNTTTGDRVASRIFDLVVQLPVEKAYQLIMKNAYPGARSNLSAAKALVKLDPVFIRKNYYEYFKQVGVYRQADFECMLNYFLDVQKLPADDPLIELMIQSVLDTSYDYWFVKNNTTTGDRVATRIFDLVVQLPAEKAFSLITKKSFEGGRTNQMAARTLIQLDRSFLSTHLIDLINTQKYYDGAIQIIFNFLKANRDSGLNQVYSELVNHVLTGHNANWWATSNSSTRRAVFEQAKLSVVNCEVEMTGN